MRQKLNKSVKYVFVSSAWDGYIYGEIPTLETYTSWEKASKSYKEYLEKSNYNGGEWTMALYKCKPEMKCEVYTQHNIQEVSNSKKVHEFDYMQSLVKEVKITKDNFQIKFEEEEM